MAIHTDKHGKIWLYSDKIAQNVIVGAGSYVEAIDQMRGTLEMFYDLLQAERTKIRQIEHLSEKLHMLLNSD